nr:class C sortase [Corynebacterium ulcerans]
MGTNVVNVDTVPLGSKQPRIRKKNVFIPVALMIVGLIVMIYPVVSTQMNNWGQLKAAQEYSQLQNSVPQEVKDEEWERAHKYNEERTTGPIFDPWIGRITADNKDFNAYLKQINSQDVMGRLVIPSMKADLPIYHGTSDETLQKGVGHLFGSDLPVGGSGTHSVLTGHTGLPNATLFDNLKNVKQGDAFFIQIAGHKIKYIVDQIEIVLPNKTEHLIPVAGKDYVTLITCTPYGINTHRLLVRGHQVPITNSETLQLEKSQGMIWQWWMYVLIAAFIICSIGLAWWLLKQRNHDAEALENKKD